MRGKILGAIKILSAGIILILCCAVLAGSFVSQTSSEGERVTGEYQIVEGRSYSSVFSDDIILNVEKISKSKEGLYSVECNNAGQTITYNDIANQTTVNTAVKNKDYVWLGNGESILLTIGQYVVTSNGIVRAGKLDSAHRILDGGVSAEIRSIEKAQLKHYLNGGAEPEYIQLPIRNIYEQASGLPTYVDLAFEIENTAGADGYYELIFDYIHGAKTTSATFGFFIIRATTYNATVIDGNNSYSVMPTVKVNETTYTSSGTNRYYIGNETNDSYFPTLTFDCTKIGLTYHHTSNGLRTDYIYDYSLDRQSNGVLTVTKVRNGQTIGTFTYDKIGKSNLKNNIVSIVFTEIGEYTLDFTYKYVGVVPTGVTAPTIKERINSVSLVIHGYELAYSRPDAEYAEFRYYDIASSYYSGTNSNGSDYAINVILPNGYQKEWSDDTISRYITFCENKMGLIYKLTKSNEKAGKILEKIDPMFGNQITDITTLGESLPTESEYVKTNQGYIRILTNDTFISGRNNSFYFYSNAPISTAIINDDGFTPIPKTNMTADLFSKYIAEEILYYGDGSQVLGTDGYNENTQYYEINKKPFSNLTSFTKKGGYYLLVLKVDPNNGMSGTASQYYQVFAFRYMSDEATLTLTSNDKVLSSYDFTNNEITVSWEDPGLFDKQIVVEYFKVVNDKNITVNELKNLSSTVISTSGSKVGLNNEVAVGQFAKYLFKVSSAGGESATYTVVTIDKEPIKNVKSYLLEMSNSTTRYYSAVRDNAGNLVSTNGILSGYATLDWDNKSSGADIEVHYSFAPFITATNLIKEITVAGDFGIANGYKLGETVSGFSITKNDDRFLNIVDAKNVLSGQGVYVFELKDKAGNEYKYALIIDNTPTYFEIGGEIFVKDYRVYSNNVNFDVKNFKAIALGDLNGQDIINQFLKTPGIVSNGSEIFSSGVKVAVGDGEYQLSVKNLQIYAYSEGGESTKFTTSGTIEKTTGSKIVRLYAISTNQIYSTTVRGYLNAIRPNKSNSFIDVEINTDRSSMNVFISDVPAEEDILSANGLNSGTYIRLQEKQNYTEALAGGLKFASFRIKLRNELEDGTFEVGQIIYKYCPRTLGGFDQSGSTITIYNKNSGVSSSAYIVGDELYFTFGNTIGTEDGLYVLTRVYDGTVPNDDVETLTYYFIVDKEKIVDESKGIGNSNILSLLETENKINMAQFIESYSSDIKSFQFEGSEFIYARYIKTNKVPAVMSVPAYKFYDSSLTNVSNYYSGRLDIEVYYIDRYAQFDADKVEAYLIYSGKPENGVNSNLFKVEIYNYLLSNNKYKIYSDKRVALSDLFNPSNQNWTYVPGDYVYGIKDRVKLGAVLDDNTYDRNSVLFSCTVNAEAITPMITVEVGATERDLTAPSVTVNGNSYDIITNQDLIKITIPHYIIPEDGDTSSILAQVDNNFVEISGTAKDEKVSMYYKYGAKQGVGYDGTGDLVLYLSTYLKGQNGDILTENLSKKTEYNIKVRYKITDTEDAEKYKNCYVTYTNGTEEYYYEAEYTITVDRLAPNKNIDKLKQQDNLIQKYEKNYISGKLNENTAIENGEGYLFVNRYADYYSYGKNLNDIYAFSVSNDFEFDFTDGSIYYKQLDQGSIALSIPSTGMQPLVSISNLTSKKYYEIIEEDVVGNICQYVIYLTGDSNSFDVSVDGVKNQAISNTPLFKVDEIEFNSNRAFYNIVLERLDRSSGTIVHREVYNKNTSLIDLTGGYDSIESEIKNALSAGNKLNVGNYQLQIYGQIHAEMLLSISLNIYSLDDIKSISAAEILDRTYGRVDLDKASKYDRLTNAMYYAVTVSIKEGSNDEAVYTCVPSRGWIFVDGNNVERHSINLSFNTTYQIIVENLGGDKSIEWYNSSKTDFHNITFESKDFNPGYYQEGNNYYSISNAVITFDKEIFTSCNVNGEPVHLDGRISLNVNDNEKKNFVVELIYNGEPNKTYVVTIDKQVIDGEMRLRDIVTGANKSDVISSKFNTLDYFEVSSEKEKFTSGDKILTWGVQHNNYFDYDYYAVRQTSAGAFEKIDLNEFVGIGVYNIKPSPNYKDEVWFVTEIREKNSATIIGNKVYAMTVKSKNNYYYMVSLDGKEIKSNSSFVYADVSGISGMTSNPITAELNVIAGYGNVPLYVTNQDLTISYSEDYDLTKTKFTKISGNHTLEIYYITSTSTSVGQAFGIYTVKSANPDYPLDPVSELKILGGEDPENIVSDKTVVYQPTLQIKQATMYSEFKKNPMVITYYYIDDDSVVTKVLEPSATGTYQYPIGGHGPYTFVISDLAGNTHLVGGNAEFTVNVLTEITALVNSQPYVENAYYNKDVDVQVVGINYLDSTSLTVQVKRNGVAVKVADPKHFTLTEAGNYEIVFTANIKNQKEQTQIETKLNFAIVNKNEAYQIFDFTPLLRYQINSIIDSKGQDFTELFKELMLENGVGSVKYDDVLYKIANTSEYSDLILNSGIQRFTLNYTVIDEAYPERNVTTEFSMNNQTPTITCTLKPGEETNKSFAISYNPGVIYSQIGEAQIYVNNTLIYTINEDSPSEILTNKFSFDRNGAGDYQISLITASGAIASSYVVTIKAPLNTSAIIIIVVVSVAVVGVAVTIIVLRRRMRIR